MKVQIFIPCFVDQLYPQVGMNMVKILEKIGCDVQYNPSQTCCGQPAYNAGFIQESSDICKKFLKDFDGDGYIVSPSGSCTGFIRHGMKSIFENDMHLSAYQEVAPRVFEISEFLEKMEISDLGAEFDARVTYHDACGALRECGIRSYPRKLLSGVKKLELVEMKDSETCCGFGGSFAVKYEPISIGMAQSKVANARETGAEYIVSTDVSCLMHIDAYIKKQGLPLKTLHLVDILSKF